MDTKIIKLEYPVTAPDGTEIKELVLRRLKAKEMKSIDPQPSDGKFGGVLKFVAAMNGMPNAALDELDAVDVIQLTSECAGFLAPGTGGTPSS